MHASPAQSVVGVSQPAGQISLQPFAPMSSPVGASNIQAAAELGQPFVGASQPTFVQPHVAAQPALQPSPQLSAPGTSSPPIDADDMASPAQSVVGASQPAGQISIQPSA